MNNKELRTGYMPGSPVRLKCPAVGNLYRTSPKYLLLTDAFKYYIYSQNYEAIRPKWKASWRD